MADFSKPRRALCVFLGLCAASAFILALGNGTGGGIAAEADESFTVTQRFYGMDAAELERIAAIPLENALSGIAGVRRIYSSCENGRVRIIARFEGRVRGRYEAVREAAQRVYETLPSAAQRPEIASSGDSRVPVWTAAVIASGGKSPGMALEKIIKPALEGLPGAGEVEISGAGLREIVITLKSEEALARNIDAAALAKALSYNDALLPGGTLRRLSRTGGAQEIPVMVDGRYGTGGTDGSISGELKNALVAVPSGEGTGKNFVPLRDLADITEQERDYESRARLNGKEAALIAVMGSDGADLGKLSLLIGEELAKYGDLEFTVLSDAGEAERKAYSSVMGAALQGACCVALLAALLCSRRGSSFSAPFFCALTVPAACFFSSALLALLGRPPDKLVLAGLACGAGAAVDASILSVEYFRSCRSPAEGRKALERLRFPLISGSVTTIAALLPLMVRRETGMNSVAWAIAAVNFTAMVLALTLLPPLFLWTGTEKKLSPPGRFSAAEQSTHRGFRKRRLCNRLFRCRHVFRRLFYRQTFRGGRFCRRCLALVMETLIWKPAAVLGGWILITVLGCVSLVLKGADVEQGDSGDYVYAQAEFDGGLHISETDRLLASYADELKQYPGIESVQTVARTGTGSVMTGFDPLLVKEKTVREWIRSLSPPGGFVYLVETRGNERSWRIRISGDEEKRCQELAAEAGRICSALEGVSETVLHFKDGSPRLDLEAERDKLAFGGMSYGSIGEAVRRTIHGPVAYKRMAGDSFEGSAEYAAETDVRIRGGTEVTGREGVFDILIRNEDRTGTPLTLDSLVTAETGRDASSIQREDRRRCASFSIRTAPEDPRRVRDRVMETLSRLDLPPGYSVDFDPEAIKAAGGVTAQAGLFVLALLLCYMLIAAFKESFTFPLAVMAVVPPSLAVPALWMVLGAYPLSEVSAAAFVAVSGMAVNAAVLVADHLQDMKAAPAMRALSAVQTAGSFYRIFRKRLPVLAATAGTTVGGALPFLFVGAGAARVVKTLSLVGALGVAVSAICAATLIPALVKLFPGILRSHSTILS
ncbi:MAG: efflux RND transporter permease subunit [Spirochaetaceae bacterium]|jgi:multidrug efflux pump subunit AcrB|nr:efflux RND transporter permease subunit [Spirochaetaceae bacterium]